MLGVSLIVGCSTHYMRLRKSSPLLGRPMAHILPSVQQTRPCKCGLRHKGKTPEWKTELESGFNSTIKLRKHKPLSFVLTLNPSFSTTSSSLPSSSTSRTIQPICTLVRSGLEERHRRPREL